MTNEDRQEYVQLRVLLVRLIEAMKARERGLLDNPERKALQLSVDLAEDIELERLDANYRREEGKISDKLLSLNSLYRGLAEIGSYTNGLMV